MPTPTKPTNNPKPTGPDPAEAAQKPRKGQRGAWQLSTAVGRGGPTPEEMKKHNSVVSPTHASHPAKAGEIWQGSLTQPMHVHGYNHKGQPVVSVASAGHDKPFAIPTFAGQKDMKKMGEFGGAKPGLKPSGRLKDPMQAVYGNMMVGPDGKTLPTKGSSPAVGGLGQPKSRPGAQLFAGTTRGREPSRAAQLAAKPVPARLKNPGIRAIGAAHAAEARARGVEIGNFGKGTTSTGLYSTTSHGGFESEWNPKTGKIEHTWHEADVPPRLWPAKSHQTVTLSEDYANEPGEKVKVIGGEGGMYYVERADGDRSWMDEDGILEQIREPSAKKPAGKA